MPEELLFALSFYRKGRYVVVGDEARRDIVLRREWIGGTEEHIRTTRFQRAYQIRCLRRDVETGRKRFPFEGLLLFKTSSYLPEDRHVALGPLDALFTFWRELRIFDIGDHPTIIL